jgi:hypothetical protein
MAFLYKMFSDVEGDPSTNRMLSTFVTIFPLLVWAWTVYKAGAWVPMPEELLWLVGGGLTSKVVQRKIEQDKECKISEKL